MLKLFDFRDIHVLNEFLDQCEKDGLPVKKVKLCTRGKDNQLFFFVLVDTNDTYQKED